MRTAVLRAALVAYVALVCAPLAAVVPGPSLPLLAGSLLLGAVLGAVLTARFDPMSWFETYPRGLTGFLPPVAWFAVALATGPTPDGVAVSPWFAGAVAVVPWLLAVAAASYCWTKDRIENATVDVTFEARPPSALRNEYARAGAVVVGLAVLGGVVSVALGGGLDENTLLTWLPAATVVWVVLLDGQDPSTVRITDAGVAVGETLHRWETIEGYSVGEGELSLSRTKWYHSRLRYDCEDIDDLDAVTAALDEHLN